jgi:hypothetical protein
VSHLDTAFKLGAAQAQQDFDAELNKIADLPEQAPAGKVPIRPQGPPEKTIGPGPLVPKPAPAPKLPPLQPRPGMGAGPQ